MHSQPALAREALLGAQSQSRAAELESLLHARGATLPSLKSSPNVGVLRRTSAALPVQPEGGGRLAGQLLSPSAALVACLDWAPPPGTPAWAGPTKALGLQGLATVSTLLLFSSRHLLAFTTSWCSQQLATTRTVYCVCHLLRVTSPASLRLLLLQLPSAAPAGPAQGGELLQELKRESREVQRLRQELESTQRQLTQRAAAPPPQAATSAPAPPTPAEAPGAVEDEEEGGSAFAALNLVGILAAGGLGGYLTIQRKQAAEAESSLQQQLSSEAQVVEGLRGQVGSVREALATEQALAVKLRGEAAAASTAAQRQLELERDAKEAVRWVAVVCACVPVFPALQCGVAALGGPAPAGWWLELGRGRPTRR